MIRDNGAGYGGCWRKVFCPAILAVAAWLAGCAPETQPPLTYFSIGHPVTMEMAVAGSSRTEKLQGTVEAGGAVIKFPAITGHALFMDSGICYSDAPLVMDTYTLAQWISPPAEMLHGLAVVSIERSGVFGSVIMPGSQAAYDYVLEARLLDFCLFITGQQPGIARVSLFANLVDAGSGRVVCSSILSHAIAAESNSAEDAAEAMNEASMRVVKHLTKWLGNCIKNR